ncbi:MAG TPA: hypothetical protein VHJ83_02825, partial [Micromonosporaceae bacterium]|nr:hypothetical protein [Micromonosporaceae bacterium]
MTSLQVTLRLSNAAVDCGVFRRIALTRQLAIHLPPANSFEGCGHKTSKVEPYKSTKIGEFRPVLRPELTEIWYARSSCMASPGGYVRRGRKETASQGTGR